MIVSCIFSSLVTPINLKRNTFRFHDTNWAMNNNMFIKEGNGDHDRALVRSPLATGILAAVKLQNIRPGLTA